MELNECTRTLWSHRVTFRPYLLDAIFGDGQQFMKVWPMNYRPRFYVVRIDSRVSFITHDEDSFFEDIDFVLEAIEEEVGTCCDEYGGKECSCEIDEVWPSFTANTWGGWCWDRMDDDERRELIP